MSTAAQTNTNSNNNRPLARFISVFRGPTRSRPTDSSNSFFNINSLRLNRPTRRGTGNVDLIANLEGTRAFQSSKSFVTQGIILPVNIDKSSLTIMKLSELELEITGTVDCNVNCRIIGQSDSWKKRCIGSTLNEGLCQEFSIVIPNFASFGPKSVELIISELSENQDITKKDDYSNPFYVNEQFTRILLTRNEDGMILLKAEDQYIKLRNKNFSLLEIFGKPLNRIRSNASSPTSYCSDGLSNRECIVCMSEVKDTIVLPCRHMCLCSECAEAIRGRSDKCPLCRQGKN